MRFPKRAELACYRPVIGENSVSFLDPGDGRAAFSRAVKSMRRTTATISGLCALEAIHVGAAAANPPGKPLCEAVVPIKTARVTDVDSDEVPAIEGPCPDQYVGSSSATTTPDPSHPRPQIDTLTPCPETLAGNPWDCDENTIEIDDHACDCPQCVPDACNGVPFEEIVASGWYDQPCRRQS